MNKKTVKKLKEMAAIFCQAQSPDVPYKPVKKIYKELKQIHKNKAHGKATKTKA